MSIFKEAYYILFERPTGHPSTETKVKTRNLERTCLLLASEVDQLKKEISKLKQMLPPEPYNDDLDGIY